MLIELSNLADYDELNSQKERLSIETMVIELLLGRKVNETEKFLVQKCFSAALDN